MHDILKNADILVSSKRNALSRKCVDHGQIPRPLYCPSVPLLMLTPQHCFSTCISLLFEGKTSLNNIIYSFKASSFMQTSTRQSDRTVISINWSTYSGKADEGFILIQLSVC